MSKVTAINEIIEKKKYGRKLMKNNIKHLII